SPACGSSGPRARGGTGRRRRGRRARHRPGLRRPAGCSYAIRRRRPLKVIGQFHEPRLSNRSMTQRNWVLALAAVASFMVATDPLVVSTALPPLRADLAASVEQLEWTVNAYNLSFAVLLLPASALGDRFGRRRIFTAGLALFSLASAACALAPDAATLIAA